MTAKIPAENQKLVHIAPLFAGWEETMISSCLAGCMGYAIADNDEYPAAAQIVVGAFSYMIYPGGIEIEIDTKPDYRGRGLATACGGR